MNSQDDRQNRTPRSDGRSWKNLTGLEIYPLVIVALIAAWRGADLIRMATAGTLAISLEATGDGPVRTDFGGGVSVPTEGMVGLALPLDELAPVTIGFQVVADVLMLVGMLVAGLVAARVINLIARGQIFDRRSSRSMLAIFAIVFVTGVLSGLAQMLGDNLVIRDLGLNDLPVHNGISSAMIWTWLAVLGGIGILQQLLDRGRRTEDELAGVI